MPKSKSNKPESVNHAAVSERLQDDFQVETSLAQWRREYLALVPAALNIFKRTLEGGPIDKDMLSAASQVLKGTGVHEERTRSQKNVKISRDFRDQSDDELNRKIREFLPPEPAAEV